MKHIFRFTIILLLITTLGFGCKGLSKEEQAALRPVSLEYWTVFNDVTELKKFADAYKQVRPYVNVNIKQIRFEEFNDRFLKALADDVEPDIISIHTRGLAEHAHRLLPMPKNVQVAKITVKGQYAKETIVTQETNAMPAVKAIENNFVKTVADDVIQNDQVLGLPLALDTLALYYNKTLLDQSGIPEPPRNWGEFLSAAQQATKFNNAGQIVQSGVALGTGNNIDNAADIVALLMMQNGVEVTKGKAVAFANGMDKPAPNHPAFEAMRFYTDFSKPTKEAYSWNAEMGNALEEFARGKVVFYFGFAFDLPRIKARAPQMDIGVLPIPQLNPNAPSNVANYWVESVVKKTDHPNEAWDFVRFMTTPENIAKYTTATKRPTPLRAQITEQEKDELLAPFVSTVLTAKNWYRGRDMVKATTAIENMIEAYRQPYTEKENPIKRDAEVIINAAKAVQQTM